MPFSSRGGADIDAIVAAVKDAVPEIGLIADVALDARQAWVAWLREDASGQSLWLARYAPDLSRELSRTRVAATLPDQATTNHEAVTVMLASLRAVAEERGVDLTLRETASTVFSGVATLPIDASPDTISVTVSDVPIRSRARKNIAACEL